MMETDHTPASCDSVQAELPALLYGELESAEVDRIEAHLHGCEVCSAELEAHHRTMQLLNHWSVDVDEMAPRARTQLRRRRPILQRIRPLLAGAVAAALMFAILGIVGADIRVMDGQTVVTLGRADPSAVQDGFEQGQTAMQLRAVARREVDHRFETLLEALDALLIDFGRQEEQQRILLARSLGQRRDEDRREQAAILRALVRHVEDESRMTRGELEELRGRIVSYKPARKSFD